MLLLALPAAAAAAAAAAAPHVVYVMGDDVGWHDVSWHNPSIHTPVLAGLLKEGVELDRMYTYKYCSPTRSSLMTGRLPIHNTQINDEATMNGKRYLVGVDVRMTMLPRKLARAGYVSYQIGKWHLGAYTAHQIPVARGYNHSFGYLSGGEDHYSQTTSFKAFGTPTGQPPKGGAVDLWRDDGPAYGENGTYSAFMYTAEAVMRIEQHPAGSPMFMYLAYQNNHCPLQVPERFQDKSIANDLRRIYHGMSACLDESVGNVTAALKAKGMWATTWLIFTPDNGGPTHTPADGCASDKKQPGMTGANNYPLRGGKVSDFEGGVRVAGFISGGALPDAMRGKTLDGMLHVADLHATICALAGIDAADDAPSAAGLPPVDGMDMVPYLTGKAAASPRTELMLGWWGKETVLPGCIQPCPQSEQYQTGGAIIVGDHKYISGYQLGMAFWTGPEHPNDTADAYPVVACMKKPCVFNIRDDPTEHTDLAGTQPELLKSLEAKLQGYLPGFFQTTDYGPAAACQTEEAMVAGHKGFMAPMCT